LTGTSYADNDAPLAGKYYVYTVKAYNSAGIASEYIKANCASVQRVIAPKTGAANVIGGINVLWPKVAGASKYVVLRRIGTESTWKIIGETTSNKLLDTNVTEGIYYIYSVRAVNNSGYSEYDINKRITVQRILTPLATATNLVNGVQVKWNAVTSATKYNVYRRTAGSSVWTLLGTTTGTSFNDKNVVNGTYYVYSIRAINGTGYSAFDTTKTDTIQPITAPTAKLTNKSNGIHISWDAVAGATKYNVYRRAAGSSTWVYVATTTSLGGLDTGVAKGNYYAYSIRAINGTGYSAYDSSKCASIKYS
jgi:fibronectin type 3 domain-containing protein